ncbi:hypothetical protein BGZ63DRAFT_6947 [Mariannaea sp. PMI_226]|nr:hypothetical protein BGZ63DRAFT_6947 [Mariannaea sp. PMI_226]
MASSLPAQPKDAYVLQGGCVCGHIRYGLTQAPLLVHCCHCTSCQRQTGSAFAINAIVESTSLVLLPSANPSIAGSKANPNSVPTFVTPAFAASTDASDATATPAGSGNDIMAISKPKPVCLPSESGFGVTVVHCPSCLTSLWNYYGDGGPHVSYVRASTLDKPWEVEPDVHIFTRSRRAFIEIGDGKPQFPEYYQSREELLGDKALERWIALKPIISQWREEVKAALGKAQAQ